MQLPARRVPAAAFAAMFSLAIAVTATAAGTLDRIHIDTFARVNDVYYRGAQPQGSDYADLAKLGIKTIINLIGDEDLDAGEETRVTAQGMRYVNIAMSTRVAPTAQQLDRFLSIVNDPANQPVYVHCVGGRHRTGVMTAVYRMTHDGISGNAAFQEMKQFKYGPDFLHPEFKKFVQTYDARGAAVAVNAQHQ